MVSMSSQNSKILMLGYWFNKKEKENTRISTTWYMEKEILKVNMILQKAIR